MIKIPNRDIHNLICELAGINSKKANYINHMMDLPSQFMGSNHRELFHGQHSSKFKTRAGTLQVNKFKLTNKDLLELYALTKFDSESVKAWLLHLVADGVYGTSFRTYNKKSKSKR